MVDSPHIDGEEETQPSAAELEAAGQSALFGGPVDSGPEKPAPVAAAAAPAPAAPKSVAAQPYRVLARKYRPQTFAELIGQDAMVKTLANAIARDRLAHAFLMTGVRGVGKTSTARLIAKALNCVGPDGQGGPTISPCGQCEPCTAIAEGRHIDVIEMDAASHTGVDDVREIIEAVRYAAVSARYKIYIIDEVHMLSRNAFNALLKTLEEPPAHVKFLFATTEVDKLPVTVLSRCQRFDLRRIPTPLLKDHFAGICVKEGVEAEDDALAMVAGAAEGSVRDGLSILDQAIAHADLDTGGKVTGERVRDMLGLADRSALRTLFAALLNGDPQGLLALVDNQYSLGVEPLALMRSLMDICHRITVAQVGRSGGEAATAEERALIEEWAEKLSAGQLHRLWQLLLKGHDEVRQAPDPLVAAQMALLRVMHAADMPDPGTLAKKLEDMAASGAFAGAPASSGTSGGEGAPQARVVVPAVNWADLVDRVEHSGLPGHMTLANKMKLQVRVADIAPGKLVYSLAPPFKEDLSAELRDAFLKITGERWEVERVEQGGESTLVETVENAKSNEIRRIREAPLVKAAFEAFPAAELVEEEAQPSGGQRQWGRR
ncbi:DNA polymerase III subunit gamma/tau [Erythrobacter sp. SG61-1L]|uniref:DNA polymerase III subunit gamma/tau n=1 Tax=Erythrobacter sp. SG61-1L TaxID=1603897 RepID=UPI0006C935C7|nr:DNA polymerase III subunit gamma/tau [Erythrobacter sp. SG61-1L]